MSSVKLQGNAGGSGSVTLASPNTNNNITLTLPSTTGSANQALLTDGSGGLTFGSAGFSGGTSVTSAVDVTLTASSTQVQNINMTATGKFVILPDATTLTEGTFVFTIYNSGANTFGIKTSSGKILLASASSFYSYSFTLNDNSTADGKWNYTTQSGLLFGSNPTSVSSITTYTGGADGALGAYALTSTTALILYTVSTSTVNLVIATVSGSTVTFGTPVTVFSSTYSYGPLVQLVGLSSTSAVVFANNGSTGVTHGFAVSISGSTITVGGATSTGLTSGSSFVAMADTTSTGLFASQNATNTSVRAFSVSGTTLTFGTTSSNIITVTTGDGGYGCLLAKSAANTFVVLAGAFANGVSVGLAKHRGLSLSGTTITLGTTTTNVSTTAYPNIRFTFYQVGQANFGLTSTNRAGSGWVTFLGTGTLTVQYSGTAYVASSEYSSTSGATGYSFAVENGNGVITAATVSSGVNVNYYIPQQAASPAYTQQTVYSGPFTAFGAVAGLAYLDANTALIISSTSIPPTGSTPYLSATIVSYIF